MITVDAATAVFRESAFAVDPLKDGGWLVRVAVLDPCAGRSGGGLSTKRPAVASVVTAVADRSGRIGEFDVTTRVLRIERHFTFAEADDVLRQRDHPWFLLIDPARQLASLLRFLRATRFHLKNDRGLARDGLRRDGTPWELPSAHIIDQELGLLANHLYARSAHARRIPFVYRNTVKSGTGGTWVQEPGPEPLRSPRTSYFPYGRLTSAARHPDSRRNGNALIAREMDEAWARLRLDPLDPSGAWLRELLDAAGSGAPGQDVLWTPRIVEAAELLGGPPPWLVSRVHELLGRDADERVPLLHSLLVAVRTDSTEWKELRRAGLDACIRFPELIKRTVERGEWNGSLRQVRFSDRQWPPDVIDGQVVTMHICDVQVGLRSGDVMSAIGYAADRDGARHAAMLGFLAQRAGLGAPSVAPFDLHAVYRCLIEDRPDLVVEIPDEAMSIVVSHLRDLNVAPGSLLAELSSRVADLGRLSAGVDACPASRANEFTPSLLEGAATSCQVVYEPCAPSS